MPDTLTIPAPLARPVAEAAYTLLGRASSSVLRRTESTDRRAEQFEGPFRQFDTMRRLIEALGPIEPGQDASLSDEHAPALADALREGRAALAHTAHEEGDTEQAREYTAELVALTEYAEVVRVGRIPKASATTRVAAEISPRPRRRYLPVRRGTNFRSRAKVGRGLPARGPAPRSRCRRRRHVQLAERVGAAAWRGRTDRGSHRRQSRSRSGSPANSASPSRRCSGVSTCGQDRPEPGRDSPRSPPGPRSPRAPGPSGGCPDAMR
jgi:hypothetical protein